MNKLFAPKDVDEFERIITSESGSNPKKNGFKDVIEPAKVKALNYADPVLKDVGIWKLNQQSKFVDDLVLMICGEEKRSVEYKISIKTFHDPINYFHVPIEDYIVFSKKQFERYKMEPNKTIFFERLISNFDPSTEVGSHNLKAYRFAGKSPWAQWDYLFFQTSDFVNWKQDIDYWEVPIKGDQKNVMYVVNKNRAPNRINLVEHLKDADNYGVLLSRYHGTTKTNSRKTLDELHWLKKEDSILDFP